MFLKKEQKKVVAYQLLLYSVLILATFALIAEILPEVEAKTFVVSVLLLIVATCVIDLYRLREGTHIAQEER